MEKNDSSKPTIKREELNGRDSPWRSIRVEDTKEKQAYRFSPPGMKSAGLRGPANGGCS